MTSEVWASPAVLWHPEIFLATNEAVARDGHPQRTGRLGSDRRAHHPRLRGRDVRRGDPRWSRGIRPVAEDVEEG